MHDYPRWDHALRQDMVTPDRSDYLVVHSFMTESLSYVVALINPDE